MKALERYQIILLGEQRQIGVNLPKVVARQRSGRESNPRSAHRESSALTTAPPSLAGTGLKAGKVMAVCGRGVAYHPHNWTVSAAHCRLRAM